MKRKLNTHKPKKKKKRAHGGSNPRKQTSNFEKKASKYGIDLILLDTELEENEEEREYSYR